MLVDESSPMIDVSASLRIELTQVVAHAKEEQYCLPVQLLILAHLLLSQSILLLLLLLLPHHHLSLLQGLHVLRAHLLLLALLLCVLLLSSLLVLLTLLLPLLGLLGALWCWRLARLIRVCHARLRTHLTWMLTLCTLLVRRPWLSSLVAALRVGLLHRKLLLHLMMLMLLLSCGLLLSHEHDLLLLQMLGQLDCRWMHPGIAMLHVLHLLWCHALLHTGNVPSVCLRHLLLHQALLHHLLSLRLQELRVVLH